MARRPSFDATMRFVVLHGKDGFLLQHYADELQTTLQAEHGEVDRIHLAGSEVDVATVLDELRTLDLLSQYKLVVVDDADVLVTAGRDGKATARRALERYAQAPVDSATLLLRATTWRAGKLDKAVNGVGLVHKIEPPSDADAARWCRGRATKEHGCEIAEDAAHLLVQRIGATLTRLDGELGKLAAHVAPATMISRDDVVEMVGLSRQEQAWEIQSVLLGGDSAATLAKVAELTDVSRQPRELLAWSIVDLSRRLHAACSMLSAGRSQGEIRKALRLFGAGGDQVLSAARRRQPREFAALFSEAIAIDARVRQGLLESRRGLELLALKVSGVLH